MFKILRVASGERVFRGATISALALLTLFFVGIIVSLLTYTSWGTFLSALLSKEILFAIKLSLLTATAATIISVIIAVPTAYAISRAQFWGKDIVDSMLDLPIVISPIALGAALLVFFNTPIGHAINEHVPFVFAVPGIILAQITVVSALAIRLLKSTFDSIDPRYEQVGRTLGCSKLEAFFRVILPLSKDGLVASSILTWARAVGEFGATVTLAGATIMKTETLPIAIFLSLASADIEKAVAVIFILVIIAVVALLVIRKLIGRRYTI
jgi:molybdate transport system permease protein